MSGARGRRPSQHESVISKRFRPLRSRPPKTTLARSIHPLMVIHDLRQGSLTSLDAYLRLNGGIPDRGVAVELRKLISGSRQRSRYRLIAIEHPKGPPAKRGRPESKRGVKPTEKQKRLVRSFEKAVRDYPKVGSAVARVVEVEGVSPSRVYAARLAVKRYQEFLVGQATLRDELNRSAEHALAKLKQRSTSG